MQETAVEFVYSGQTENEDDNGSLWVEVIIVSSLDAVATLQQTIMT